MKIVRVKWVDSLGYSAWRPMEEARNESIPDAIETVGYLLKSRPKSVTIVQSLGATGNCDNAITIPRCAIKGKVVVLAEAKIPTKGEW